MIVNPPRTEAEFSSRLQAISVHAADQFDDSADRPSRIPKRLFRWSLILGPVLLLFLTIQGLLYVYTFGPPLFGNNAAMADMYRSLARDAEETAIEYRKVIATDQARFVRKLGSQVDPVMAKAQLPATEQLLKIYRQSARNAERLNQGWTGP